MKRQTKRFLIVFLTFNSLSSFYLTYAFGSFLDKVTQSDRSGPNWVIDLYDAIGGNFAVTVARGRSLQGPHTDETNPRILIHAQEGADQIFLGINRKSGECEVIQWNPDTQKYDFKIIPDIRSKIIQVNQSATIKKSCIPCHQHEGPIFSNFPWVGVAPLKGAKRRENDEEREFTVGSLDLKRFASDESQKIEGVARRVNRKGLESILGVNAGEVPGRLFRFHEFVQTAAMRLTRSRFCSAIVQDQSFPSTLKLDWIRNQVYEIYLMDKASLKLGISRENNADLYHLNQAGYPADRFQNQEGQTVEPVYFLPSDFQKWSIVREFMQENQPAKLHIITQPEQETVTNKLLEIIQANHHFPQPSFLVVDRAVFNPPVRTESTEDYLALLLGHPEGFVMQNSGNAPTASVYQDQKSIRYTNPMEPRPNRSDLTYFLPDGRDENLDRRFKSRIFHRSIRDCVRQTNPGRPNEFNEKGSLVWGEEVLSINSKDLENFLLSNYFSDLLKLDKIPSLIEVKSAWVRYQKQDEIESIVPHPQKAPIFEGATPATHVLRASCTSCHSNESFNSAKLISLLSPEGHILPSMVAKIHSVVTSGKMGKLLTPKLSETAKKDLLEDLEN